MKLFMKSTLTSQSNSTGILLLSPRVRNNPHNITGKWKLWLAIARAHSCKPHFPLTCYSSHISSNTPPWLHTQLSAKSRLASLVSPYATHNHHVGPHSNPVLASQYFQLHNKTHLSGATLSIACKDLVVHT